MRAKRADTVCGPIRVGFPYKIRMAVTLICPKCKAATELRGMMDVWYLTWCPDCERLWRFGLWTLLDSRERDFKVGERASAPKP
jgi:hypothetical protein